MRIENTIRPTNIARRGGANRATGGDGFFVVDDPAIASTNRPRPVTDTRGIGVLLALQGVDTSPYARKRRALRRGRDVLDALEAVKADLLVGRVPEGRLADLVRLVATLRERGSPEIDPILDDIDLRARVELAKLGRFPT